VSFVSFVVNGLGFKSLIQARPRQSAVRFWPFPITRDVAGANLTVAPRKHKLQAFWGFPGSPTDQQCLFAMASRRGQEPLPYCPFARDSNVHSSSDLWPFGHVLTCFYRVTILQTRDFSGFGAYCFSRRVK